MSVYSLTFGILAATLATVTAGPSFTLASDGAVDLVLEGDEAQFGIIPAAVNGSPIFAVTLGATKGEGSLTLLMAGDRVPSPGRYPVRAHGFDADSARSFHPCFVAGTVERPVAVFRGEQGWVTITRAGAGGLEGEFELGARGFLVADLEDENRWVTLRGRFEATGDSTIAVMESMARTE